MKKIFLLIGALSLGLGFGQFAQAQVLLHDYNFSNSNGDDSVGDSNGVALVGDNGVSFSPGAMTLSQNFYNGNGVGLEITGPDVANSAVAGINGSFTIEDFVSTPDENNDYLNNSTSLFGFGADANDYLLLDPDGGGYNVGLSNAALIIDQGGTVTNISLNYLLGNTGENMIALTYNATSNVMSVYLDGALEGSATLPDQLSLSALAGTNYGGIGGLNPANYGVNDGTTYNFAIYSGALSLDQIDNDFNSGAPVSGESSVPEPSTYAMMIGGLGMLLLTTRRRFLGNK